jgi:hypothetical protein
MGAIELKRCSHCARRLVSLQIDEREEFVLRSPAVICHRCDVRAYDEDAVFLPDWWD